ncbi:hypothetical protein [Candidatus Hydrogenosomobacter endosymbioticus]|uniref:DUF5667 domain-containing protein n=1 Tax=Candidatus Hydrogenosomobacter endosymbioticus TaxID=2558174 RepID=A0ABM7V8R5_9PROT|nr:hypothetical protein [Candidatus Hydrogenosomobacter endosymbioticus]BDB96165.1 hypothetical protein HYD_2980 [Candidatus Hydrogenosomobacter endosymbioticus]
MNTNKIRKIKLLFTSAFFFAALCSPASSFGVRVTVADVEYALKAVGKKTPYFNFAPSNKDRIEHLETLVIKINSDRPAKEIMSLLRDDGNDRNDDKLIEEFIKIARDRNEEVNGKTKPSYNDSQMAFIEKNLKDQGMIMKELSKKVSDLENYAVNRFNDVVSKLNILDNRIDLLAEELAQTKIKQQAQEQRIEELEKIPSTQINNFGTNNFGLLVNETKNSTYESKRINDIHISGAPQQNKSSQSKEKCDDSGWQNSFDSKTPSSQAVSVRKSPIAMCTIY